MPTTLKPTARSPESSLAEDWRRAAPLLREAIRLTGGAMNERDVFDALMEGRNQLWLGDASAVVTCIVNHPRVKTGRAFLAGGELAEIREMQRDIATWGWSLGCTRAELVGRRGWKRVFPEYEELCTVFMRNLDNGVR